MQATTQLDAVDDLLTEEEWVGKLTVWRESTSTSPLGLHLGHHKALIYPFEDDDLDGKQSRREMFNNEDDEDSDSDEEKDPSLEEMRKDLLHAQLMLMNYAIKYSYVYRRWLNVVNMMILKDEGDTRVHRLRILHL